MNDTLCFFGGIFLYMLFACVLLAGLGGLIAAALAINGWIALTLLLYIPAAATFMIWFLEWWDEL